MQIVGDRNKNERNICGIISSNVHKFALHMRVSKPQISSNQNMWLLAVTITFSRCLLLKNVDNSSHVCRFKLIEIIPLYLYIELRQRYGNSKNHFEKIYFAIPVITCNSLISSQHQASHKMEQKDQHLCINY